MAETNDPIAHIASENLLPNSISMLNGQRYHQRHRFEANQYFRIPLSIWNHIKDDTSSNQYDVNGNSYNFIQLLKWYLKRHFYHQQGRLLTLERYYQGDNDIHYWRSNKIKRADNRIANNYPRYITDFDSGLFVGKPIKYGYLNASNDNDDGSDLLNLIKEFNSFTDSRHHDLELSKDLLNTGRAYELEFVVPGTHAPKVSRIDPNQCFIIWSTDIDSKELCAVRYTMQRIENQWDYQIEVYTDSYVYQFDAGSDVEDGDWQLESKTPNLFGEVPVTEYILNDERLGAWEPELDDIDALDVSMSEMANSEEDFSNATLIIEGAVKTPSKYQRLYSQTGAPRPLFYKHGHDYQYEYLTTEPTTNGFANKPAYTKRTMPTDSNVMWLKPSTDNQGNVKSQPQMQYLTKQLDVNEWQVFINELKDRIERFCGVPVHNEKQGSSGQQNEMAVMMHLLSAIENTSDFESNFRHGVIRRIQLLVDYYSKLGIINSNIDQNDPNDVSIHFDINLPIDLQGTSQELQILAQTGDFSKHTIREVGSRITGVNVNEEDSLVNSENADQQQSNMANQQSFMNSVANANSMGSSNAPNNVISSSNVDSSSSSAANHALNSSDSSEIPSSSQSDIQSNSSSGNFSQTSSQAKQSSANSTGNSIVNSYLAETNDDPSMADNDIKYMNRYVDSNGSVIAFDNPRADNMLPGMFLIDSLYGAQMGFPSGWDSVLSSAANKAMSSSMASAIYQSAITSVTDSGNNVPDADDSSDDYIDSLSVNTSSTSSD